MGAGFFGLGMSGKIGPLILFLTLNFVGTAFLRPTLVAKRSAQSPRHDNGT
jgi:hypothetical protein